MWIKAINGTERITAQGEPNELNNHQTPQGNPISRSVYAKVRATKERILKILSPDLIKSDLS